MGELAHIGPVQLMSVGFEPGANFEGRIADELARLESSGIIRVPDLLFVTRDTDSDELVVVEHQEESMGAVAGALLGIQLDDAGGDSGHAFGVSADEIEEMGAALPHGGSVGLLLIEHVWARGLKNAIRDAGGIPFGNELLTPERIAAVEPQLAAMSEAVRASES
jgi:Family of unknown function (DUF6325)